jgi:hypothetical protein
MDEACKHDFYKAIMNKASFTDTAGFTLSTAIREGSLINSCDGSYHPSAKIAAYGTVFASPTAPIFHLAGPCPGARDHLSPLRAELVSTAVTFHIISTISTTYKVMSGSVSIYNDYDKAIKLILHPGRKFKRFLSDDYDIQQEARTLLSTLNKSITVNLLKVKGHYKGKNKLIQHDLNDKAQKLANSYQSDEVNPSLSHLIPPSSRVTLARGNPLTSKWQSIIQDAAHYNDLKHTICKRESWCDAQFAMVDWLALDKCLNKLPRIRLLSYCELLHNLLNTN